jgi:hypothetical protein
MYVVFDMVRCVEYIERHDISGVGFIRREAYD